MLLSSLYDEFEYLETALLHKKNKISLNEVYAALYSYESRKKDKKESRNISAEAMATRGHSQSRKPEKRGKSHSKTRLEKDECAFCHEKEYQKKDYPKLKKKKEKAVQDANIAVYASDDEFSLAVSYSTTYLNEWMLDSGCTYHMSPNREWFFDLKELDGGVVYMGNDDPCKKLQQVQSD